jgi:hypothetical protein
VLTSVYGSTAAAPCSATRRRRRVRSPPGPHSLGGATRVAPGRALEGGPLPEPRCVAVRAPSLSLSLWTRPRAQGGRLSVWGPQVPQRSCSPRMALPAWHGWAQARPPPRRAARRAAGDLGARHAAAAFLSPPRDSLCPPSHNSTHPKRTVSAPYGCLTTQHTYLPGCLGADAASSRPGVSSAR